MPPVRIKTNGKIIKKIMQVESPHFDLSLKCLRPPPPIFSSHSPYPCTMVMFVLCRVRVHLDMIFGSRVERRWLSSEIVLQGIGFKVIFVIRFKE
jgi:hypothetical protein